MDKYRQTREWADQQVSKALALTENIFERLKQVQNHRSNSESYASSCREKRHADQRELQVIRRKLKQKYDSLNSLASPRYEVAKVAKVVKVANISNPKVSKGESQASSIASTSKDAPSFTTISEKSSSEQVNIPPLEEHTGSVIMKVGCSNDQGTLKYSVTDEGRTYELKVKENTTVLEFSKKHWYLVSTKN